MTIPAEFNDVEHLQATIRRYINRAIRDDFSDLNDSSGNWTPSVGNTRAAMRYALTHKDNDPMHVTLGRMLLYYFTFNGAKNLQAPLYGIPVTQYQEEVSFHPQVELFFAQDSDAVPVGKSAIQARLNFRIMGETESTMTETKSKTLATAIKTEFMAANKGITFTKGKNIVSYVDKANGYYLQIYASSKVEGEGVIKKILSIQNHTYDSDRLTIHTPDRSSVTSPVGTRKVYGKQIDKQRWRPTANVRFRFATLKLAGLIRDVILIDTTGYFQDALIKA